MDNIDENTELIDRRDKEVSMHGVSAITLHVHMCKYITLEIRVWTNVIAVATGKIALYAQNDVLVQK